jgi:hypothetical protein
MVAKPANSADAITTREIIDSDIAFDPVETNQSSHLSLIFALT